jgi:hypothetical protein
LAKRTEIFNNEARVAQLLKSELSDLNARALRLSESTAHAISAAEQLFQVLDESAPHRIDTSSRTHTGSNTPVILRSWEELSRESENLESDIENLLSSEEKSALWRRLDAIGSAALAENNLDLIDASIAGLAAMLGGVIDVLLVQVPAHPGFLGSTPHNGGWLSNIVSERVGELFPPETIRSLERSYPVPFDPSTSRGLEFPVSGLGPTTHRFQSPGHDPLLGWVIGTSDVIRNTFTAFDKSGQLIIQPALKGPVIDTGLNLFENLLSGMSQVFGHLQSDVATPLGIPAPLMTLAPLLQMGSIGPREYTIGEVARQMYRSGYDFRHFLAGSVSTIIVEIIVRGAWVVRRLNEGRTISEILPLASAPRLQKTLLAAHAGAAAINSGKILFQGPLGLNWGQWLAVTRYAVPQTLALLRGAGESTRDAAIRNSLDRDMAALSARIHTAWGQ